MRAYLADILYLSRSFVGKIMGSIAYVPSRDETMKKKKICDKMEHGAYKLILVSVVCQI